MGESEELIGLIPAAGKGLRLRLPYPKELYPIIRDNRYKPISQFVPDKHVRSNDFSRSKAPGRYLAFGVRKNITSRVCPCFPGKMRELVLLWTLGLVLAALTLLLVGVSHAATPDEIEMDLAPTQVTLDIPLGIGIYDADNVAFFNQYAREEDVIAARPPFMDLLNDVEIGQKMLVFAPRDEPLTDVGPVISKAKATGVTILGYNLEAVLSKRSLLRKERAMQRVADNNDLLYVFGPTLLQLDSHYDDFVRYADVILLQSQAFQTTEGYEEQVEELIGRIRAANPRVQVWVQVAVDPPETRYATPDEVISDIKSIADTADLIWIYFGPKTVASMEAVIKGLRQ